MLADERKVALGRRRAQAWRSPDKSCVFRCRHVFMDEDALPVICQGHQVLVEEHMDVRSKEKAVIQ